MILCYVDISISVINVDAFATTLLLQALCYKYLRLYCHRCSQLLLQDWLLPLMQLSFNATLTLILILSFLPKLLSLCSVASLNCHRYITIIAFVIIVVAVSMIPLWPQMAKDKQLLFLFFVSFSSAFAETRGKAEAPLGDTADACNGGELALTLFSFYLIRFLFVCCLLPFFLLLLCRPLFLLRLLYSSHPSLAIISSSFLSPLRIHSSVSTVSSPPPSNSLSSPKA